MNTRVLRVQGKATATAVPDQATLAFWLIGKAYNYEEAVNDLNRQVETLRRDLESAAVARSELKTSGFSVTATTRRERSNDVFDGYQARHDLKLSLPLDRQHLNQVLATIARSVSAARFNISFNVKDEAPVRQQALELAVANAQRNAETVNAGRKVRRVAVQKCSTFGCFIQGSTERVKNRVRVSLK